MNPAASGLPFDDIRNLLGNPPPMEAEAVDLARRRLAKLARVGREELADLVETAMKCPWLDFCIASTTFFHRYSYSNMSLGNFLTISSHK